jgi:hypothetical protein
MSEDKNKVNASGRRPEGNRPWYSQRYGYKSNAGLAKKNLEEIPLLQFARNNNFHKFRQSAKSASIETFKLDYNGVD